MVARDARARYRVLIDYPLRSGPGDMRRARLLIITAGAFVPPTSVLFFPFSSWERKTNRSERTYVLT